MLGAVNVLRRQVTVRLARYLTPTHVIATGNER